MRARSLLALTMLTGCSIVNAPGDHRAPLAPTELCQAFAELSCAGYLDCCPTAAVIPFDACVEAAATGCTDQFGALAVNPRTGYSSEAAARAAFEGRMLTQTCDLRYADWAAQREGFQSVLQGTLAGGERCDDPVAPTLENYAPLFSCATTDRACVLGSGVWTCSSRRGRGESCVLSTDCVSTLYCTSLFGGTCEPRQVDGAGCLTDDACESRACIDLFCAPRTPDTVYCRLLED